MSEIEYFYSAHSAFAFLGSARLMEIAAAAGATIAHKPYDLHAAMAALGAGAFTERSKQHRAYFFGREIARWAEYRGVEWLGERPSTHSNDYTLANRMLIAGLIKGLNIDNLADAVLSAHWGNDADLADAGVLADVARAAGYDPEPLLQAASGGEAGALYDRNTAEAIRRSVFGSPTYFVGGDMFYGQDRLELVERALVKPFKGAWPPPE